MPALVIPRPGAHEFAPYYDLYIKRVPDDQIGRRYAEQTEEFVSFFRPVSDDAAMHRYAPGKWSVKEVIGHLCDAERVFAYRLCRIGRLDPTPLPGFEENDYVPAGQFDDRSLASLLDEFLAVRRSTVTLMDGLPSGNWHFIGEASENPVSPSALVYIMLGHVTHHLTTLRERYGLGGTAR